MYIYTYIYTYIPICIYLYTHNSWMQRFHWMNTTLLIAVIMIVFGSLCFVFFLSFLLSFVLLCFTLFFSLSGFFNVSRIIFQSIP